MGPIPCSVPCSHCAAETDDTIDAVLYDPSKKHASDVVPCFDPATMQLLGHCPAMSEQTVSRDLAEDYVGGLHLSQEASD